MITKITDAAAVTVSKLDGMAQDNWQALEGMTDGELTALWNEIDEAAVLLEMGHPHNESRQAAYRAIKNEQVRRSAANYERYMQQRTRVDNIANAADMIRRANELVEQANNLPYVPDVFTEPPVIDVSNATDAELQTALETCLNIVRMEPTKYARNAESIGLLKSTASKVICSQLREMARADEARRAKASDLCAAINAERERRERERREQAELQRPEALLERIEELEKQVRNG